jgi:hypothetical protein
MPTEKRSRAPRKRTRPVDESAWHNLDVVSWALAGESGPGAEGPSGHLQIDISVQFETPAHGVTGGDLLIYSDPESHGGIVHYDRERRRHGCLWMDVANAQVLATLLAVDKQIVLCLTGRPFKRRKMFVDRVHWFTKGHPALRPIAEGDPEVASHGCAGRQP